MWIAGTFLLIAGFLLCVSIAWAALGFLMMGLGLICLQIAERRKAQAAESPAVGSDETVAPQEQRPTPEQATAELAEPTALRSDKTAVRREPSLYPERRNAQSADAQSSPSSALRSGKSESRRKRSLFPETSEPKLAVLSREGQTERRKSAIVSYSHNSEEWLALVKEDPDIARSVAALEPFGKKYVDELARCYLALNDKDYLPVILKKIAATVKKDSGKDVASTAAIDGNPDIDLISFALSKARGLRVEQVLDARTSHDAAAGRSVPADNAPQVNPDTGQRLTAVDSGLKTSGGRPERGTGATARDHEVEAATARADARIATIPPAVKKAATAMDDAENLAELFNRLDPRTSV